VAETVRGAAMLAAVDASGADVARLHLDLTTLTVAGDYAGSQWVAKGCSCARQVRRQVRVLAASNRTGVPLYTRPHPGEAAELTCLGEVMDRLAELLPPGLLIATDSTLGHVKNLCEVDRAGLRFIVPLRADTGFALATNLPGRISATSVLGLYKDQHLVEMAHRANKSVLNVRPIFLHNDDRVRPVQHRPA
jgi:transposase